MKRWRCKRPRPATARPRASFRRAPRPRFGRIDGGHRPLTQLPGGLVHLQAGEHLHIGGAVIVGGQADAARPVCGCERAPFLGELVARGSLVRHADLGVVLGPADFSGTLPADRLEIEVGNLVHDGKPQMPTDHHCGKQDHRVTLPGEIVQPRADIGIDITPPAHRRTRACSGSVESADSQGPVYERVYPH